MKKQVLRFCVFFSFLWIAVLPGKADDWRDKMENLIYSPRYFGPNAFPIPEMMGGSLSDRWEVELRGEYHTMDGDKTRDRKSVV